MKAQNEQSGFKRAQVALAEDKDDKDRLHRSPPQWKSNTPKEGIIGNGYSQGRSVTANSSEEGGQGNPMETGIRKSVASRWLESSSEEEKIKAKIEVLERELNSQLKKAEQMQDILENTRTHYSQLENKYDQARELLKNYQEREREMIEREETHVEQLREKDCHYAELVNHMKQRIEELECKLEQVAKRRVSLVEGELSELREKLATYGRPNPASDSNPSPNLSTGGENGTVTIGRRPALPLQTGNGSTPRIGLQHAGLVSSTPKMLHVVLELN